MRELGICSSLLLLPLTPKNSGELPKGYVVLGADAINRTKGDKKALKEIEESIKEFVKKRTVNYKWLHAVEIIDEIPKSMASI